MKKGVKQHVVTSREELSKIFCLGAKDFSKLKIELANKINIYVDGCIQVKDGDLGKLINDFRNAGGALTIVDASKKYKISVSALKSMVRTKLISSYKLSNDKASKILFLESEFSSEAELFIKHTPRVSPSAINRFSELMIQLIESIYQLSGQVVSEKEISVLKLWYISFLNIHDISETVGMSRNWVSEVLKKNKDMLFSELKSNGVYKKEFEDYKTKNEDYEKRYTKLLLERELSQEKNRAEKEYITTQVKEFNKTASTQNVLQIARKLSEFEFPVRALTVFNENGLLTIGDLMKLNKPTLKSYGNIGVKTMDDVEKILNSIGIVYRNYQWQFS